MRCLFYFLWDVSTPGKLTEISMQYQRSDAEKWLSQNHHKWFTHFSWQLIFPYILLVTSLTIEITLLRMALFWTWVSISTLEMFPFQLIRRWKCWPVFPCQQFHRIVHSQLSHAWILYSHQLYIVLLRNKQAKHPELIFFKTYWRKVCQIELCGMTEAHSQGLAFPPQNARLSSAPFKLY